MNAVLRLRELLDEAGSFQEVPDFEMAPNFEFGAQRHEDGALCTCECTELVALEELIAGELLELCL